MRTIVSLSAALALHFPLAPAVHAQESTGVVGCYAFSRSYFGWSESTGWSRTSYSASTQLIELRAKAVEDSNAVPGSKQIRVPGLRDARAAASWYRHSRWRMISNDSLLLSWWDGLSGFSLRLRSHGDSLSGTAEFSGDVVIVGSPAARSVRPATARRVPCPALPETVLKPCGPSTSGSGRSSLILSQREDAELRATGLGALVVRVRFDSLTTRASVPVHMMLWGADHMTRAVTTSVELTESPRLATFPPTAAGKRTLEFSLPTREPAIRVPTVIRSGFVDTLDLRVPTDRACLRPS